MGLRAPEPDHDRGGRAGPDVRRRARYERLEGYASLQWPVAEDGTDSPLLYTERFHFPDGKARLYPLAFTEPSDQTDEEYPLHVNNGRVLEHFHEGNLTLRSQGLSDRVPDTYVELTRNDAARFGGLKTGDWVRLESRRGSITVRVLLSEQVRDGEAWVPMQAVEFNMLTSNEADKDSHTPAYKEVAVKVSRADGPQERRGGRRRGADRGRHGDRDSLTFGGSPLPRTYHRYGHPTPQDGVQVERKWEREDYVFPTEPEPDGATA